MTSKERTCLLLEQNSIVFINKNDYYTENRKLIN